MNELEYLRQQKLERMQEYTQQQAHIRQQLAQLEELAKKKLTKEALERYGNVRFANAERAFQAAEIIVRSKIDIVTDEQLKSLLAKLSETKREIKITRK